MSQLMWFRQDLRLADNPALSAAIAAGGPVVPVFIWAPDEERPWAPGAASRGWLHQSLASLSRKLAERGSRLILRRGKSLDELRKLAAETGAQSVFWNQRNEPAVVQRDTAVRHGLESRGIGATSFETSLFSGLAGLRSGSGKPYQVFTAFWRACLMRAEPDPPLPEPRHFPAPAVWPRSLDLNELRLKPAKELVDWQPGEVGAQKRLRTFLKTGLARYSKGRDWPAHEGTSRFSPYLHFGEISARQVWWALRTRGGHDAERFRRELGWREFARYLLVHFPHTTDEPLRKEFRTFPWRLDPGVLRKWHEGKTGYPLVDAGMRELRHTGWMHNRVRMIVASFLVKHLLHSWEEGARWFWDTLVDADLPNNTLGWQWSAGCGADAAPFFRIFNPVLQGEKFDADGNYVRRWVPELSRLPSAWIHKPWLAPAGVRAVSKVMLGVDYPLPMVDHDAARRAALAAFQRLRARSFSSV